MKSRLFLVANPTQYLNAVEFSHITPGFEDSIVIVTEYTKGIEEINKLDAAQKWKQVFLLDLKTLPNPAANWRSWQSCWRFIKTSFNKTKPNELVIGNLGDAIFYSFYLQHKRKVASITALDDGTPTLNLIDARLQGAFYRTYHWRGLRILLKSILAFNTFLPRYSPPKSVTFFSLFNLELNRGDTFIQNNYSWLRSKIKSSGSENRIYFVGSHIVDRHLVSESDFLDSLVQVKNLAEESGNELVYVHHRGESESVRNKIAERLKTIEFDQPLEFVFVASPMPKGFMGHFSSALFTLSRLYPVPVKAFLFPEDHIVGSSIESRDDIICIQRAIQSDNSIEARALDLS